MTTAIRLLSYGYATDYCDEYLQIRETAVVESMKHFYDVVIALYESQYMRAPNTEDVARLLQEEYANGFPRMLRFRLYTLGMEELSNCLA
ncbi:hypothetical protein Ddye_018539 [Dipteronia dyeriana]|uniref:Uncharacterized protein n=1 Tax=Dipteronia dyeriana TaxID=168575 RepID=A0AAD9UBC3_9ROSI|nr:hypothetical protein Ddye_018539 [Dipteronia dyeriana]